LSFSEWQAKVLLELYKLNDEQVLCSDSCLTIPEITGLMVGKKIGGESTVRRFLYVLKENGVLVGNGMKSKNNMVLPGYCFDSKRAFVFVKEGFEEGVLFELLISKVYSVIVHKKLF
jgi:hypothetical protein